MDVLIGFLPIRTIGIDGLRTVPRAEPSQFYKAVFMSPLPSPSAIAIVAVNTATTLPIQVNELRDVLASIANIVVTIYMIWAVSQNKKGAN